MNWTPSQMFDDAGTGAVTTAVAVHELDALRIARDEHAQDGNDEYQPDRGPIDQGGQQPGGPRRRTPPAPTPEGVVGREAGHPGTSGAGAEGTGGGGGGAVKAPPQMVLGRRWPARAPVPWHRYWICGGPRLRLRTRRERLRVEVCDLAAGELAVGVNQEQRRNRGGDNQTDAADQRAHERDHYDHQPRGSPGRSCSWRYRCSA